MFSGATANPATSGIDWLRWISLGVAVLALGISWRNYRRGQAVDRRNVFIEIHRLLLEPELVAARRELYKIQSVGDVEALDRRGAPALTHIYRVLALFDLLGYYSESKWVDLGEVLEEWSDSLDRSRGPGRHVLAWRRRMTDGPLWPHYQKLAVAATEHVLKRRRRGGTRDLL